MLHHMTVWYVWVLSCHMVFYVSNLPNRHNVFLSMPVWFIDFMQRLGQVDGGLLHPCMYKIHIIITNYNILLGKTMLRCANDTQLYPSMRPINWLSSKLVWKAWMSCNPLFLISENQGGIIFGHKQFKDIISGHIPTLDDIALASN